MKRIVRERAAARRRRVKTDLTKLPVALTYLAFGCGVQSTYMLVCSVLALHRVPKFDVAIMADTMNEPGWVYENFGWYQSWAASKGAEVITLSRGNLGLDAIARNQGTASRFANIPLWTRGEDGREAPLRRQCTREYKIEVMEKECRRRLGYKPRQKQRHHVLAMIGISLDEVGRIAPSQTHWVSNAYPLVEAGLTRGDCVRGLESLGLPVPKKSSCIFCPYHMDEFWVDLQENHPVLFQEACIYDEALRDMTRSGLERAAFVHRSLKPLREVDFRARISERDKQRYPLFLNLEGDCGGYCGQ